MKTNPRQILPRATTVGLGLIVLLFVANVCVSEWNIRRLVDNEQRVIHTHEVLTALEEVLSRVTEAETGERGFLITGDIAYLDSYQGASRRTGETLGPARSARHRRCASTHSGRGPERAR